MKLYSSTSQNVYYAIDGMAPNRTVTFEYYLADFSQSTQYTQLHVVFYENLPGIVKYIYYRSSDGGVSATIGVQSKLIFICLLSNS